MIPAPSELAGLAAAMRPDWDRASLEAALIAATSAGWDWRRLFTYVSRLLADDSASPRDLLEAARRPLDRREGRPPSAEYAAMRDALRGAA